MTPSGTLEGTPGSLLYLREGVPWGSAWPRAWWALVLRSPELLCRRGPRSLSGLGALELGREEALKCRRSGLGGEGGVSGGQRCLQAEAGPKPAPLSCRQTWDQAILLYCRCLERSEERNNILPNLIIFFHIQDLRV